MSEPESAPGAKSAPKHAGHREAKATVKAKGTAGNAARGGGRPRRERRADGPKRVRKTTELPWYRRPAIAGPLLLVAAIAIVAGVLLWRHSETHIATDDAFVDAVSEVVSPQVAGRISKVCVGDNRDVKAGDVLVELDPTDYQVQLDAAGSARAQAQAQLAEAQAQEAVYAAQVKQAQANLETAQANAVNTGHQLGRNKRLGNADPGAVSAQQLDNAVAASTSAEAQLNAARKAITAAEAEQAYGQSLIAAAQAGIGGADSQVERAALSLSYTHVIARIDGRIANKTASEGNIVAAGTPLMSVVPRDVYVTANLKETQLARLQRGQSVEITADAYPDLNLTGHVDSIQPGSGDVFSSIPAENATGNWVKVVQRVPVKITFDTLPNDPGKRLAPGMSVEISILAR
jgi:membrane fusion protein (multidrug efflux system)